MTDPIDLDSLDALYANTFRSDERGHDAFYCLQSALCSAWPAISAELRRLRAEVERDDRFDELVDIALVAAVMMLEGFDADDVTPDGRVLCDNLRAALEGVYRHEQGDDDGN